ncbi:MAG: peptidylprolyl isomerase [Polyangiaceae bacterium]
MRRALPVPFAVLATFVAAASSQACGAPAEPKPPVAQAAAPAPAADTPAGRCLAIAGARRERRADEPKKLSAKHILVKYAGAKRAPETVTRTREEACLRAQEARDKLEKGASFADVVREYSEEPGAVTREGSLGAIERGDVAPPFADATFELRVGDTSHVVETDYGFHVIQRTE